MSELVNVDIDEHIAIVTLDKPPLNLVTPQLLEELIAEFNSISANEQVRTVILTGAGEHAFCAGGDRRVAAANTANNIEAGVKLGRAAFEAIHDCAVPVIGAINGYAIGSGVGFAASCDILIASERATFQLPEIDFGMWGCIRYLSRLVPESKTRLMAYTGQKLSVLDMQRFGAIESVVPHEELMPTATRLAREIAKKSVFAVRLYKKGLNRTEHLGVKESLSVEMECILRLLNEKNAQEARRAFLDK